MQDKTRMAPQALARLLADYAAAPTPALRDRIVEANLYIARYIARRFSGRGVDYDDLFQVAALALVKALERFDPARGIQFQSFVTPSMVGEVKNYFRDKSRAIRLPRRGATLAREIDRATDALAQRLGRMPRVDELAAALAVSEDAVLEALEVGASAVVSLDAAPADEEAPSLELFLGIDETGYTAVERRDALERAMAALDERRRAILRLRYFEGLSQREIAGRLGVSQMTVSREERKALEQLRQRAREARLGESE